MLVVRPLRLKKSPGDLVMMVGGGMDDWMVCVYARARVCAAASEGPS